jgi:hypothetical protein
VTEAPDDAHRRARAWRLTSPSALMTPQAESRKSSLLSKLTDHR